MGTIVGGLFRFIWRNQIALPQILSIKKEIKSIVKSSFDVWHVSDTYRRHVKVSFPLWVLAIRWTVAVVNRDEREVEIFSVVYLFRTFVYVGISQ